MFSGLSRWLIRSGCGSKLGGTGFESRMGRMFVIEVVHIKCFKLFTGLECYVLYMVLCTIKKPGSNSRSVGHSLDFGLHSLAILP